MKKIAKNCYKKLYSSHDRLLKNIKKRLPKLEKLMERVNNHWDYEDRVYRYYHGSFKVYWIQGLTIDIVKELKAISPHKDKQEIHSFFLEILSEGTGRVWDYSHNKEWSKNCRPILEAFFHAKYFLEMAVKYGKEIKKAPELLPSGWAALLCLYRLR